MKNFFQSGKFTEILTANNEIWVFGDSIENVTTETPRIYVGQDLSWGDGTEPEEEMPITDEHGTTEWVNAKVYEGEVWELEGTTAKEKIAKFYTFNV